MEPQIIPSQLPPGMEIAIPPGFDLPPQQPLGTYQSKPLPPLPPLRPGFSRQVSAFSVASRTTQNSSRSRSRVRTTPSPAPSGQEEIERLENEISTILIQHSPTPVSRRSSVYRSFSPRSRRTVCDGEVARNLAPRRQSTPNISTPTMSTPTISTPTISTPIISTPIISTPVLATPTTGPCTLHRSSVKIKQITGLDINGLTPTRPARSAAPPEALMAPPATPDTSSSIYSADAPSSSEQNRTLSLIDDIDDESEFDSDWDFSPSSRRNYASWIPASPVPPKVEILDFDEASPRRRDSDLGPLRSPGMHHFETLPARRNNHMEVSYMGAKDLYHATATSIAASTRNKVKPKIAEPERDSILPAKNRLSFATKVLQSGRKRPPPMGINTTSGASIPAGPASASKLPSKTLHQGLHAHSLDDDRLRVKYSDAISRVFRWSGEHRRAISESASPADGGASAEPRTVTTSVTTNTASPGPASPGLPGAASSSQRMARLSIQDLAAHVKKTASSIVQSKEERRREHLRQSIRVIPEENSL